MRPARSWRRRYYIIQTKRREREIDSMVALCVRWAKGDGWDGALGPPGVRTEKVWPKKVVFTANARNARP